MGKPVMLGMVQLFSNFVSKPLLPSCCMCADFAYVYLYIRILNIKIRIIFKILLGKVLYQNVIILASPPNSHEVGHIGPTLFRRLMLRKHEAGDLFKKVKAGELSCKFFFSRPSFCSVEQVLLSWMGATYGFCTVS
jgi:hypothetical protein